ncbi:2-hydroxyacid dehydrogenase [Thermoleptolyngbya sp. PKUAC-SCTB121]|uniref:2-hydroxyacid dehydrogenase n=1 Tax=Thermoleptolyngbya sp. PKUAC-SCTB121 TaxID=2811482 RepID=UPI0019623368|nr:2-hydroxyacid dehydrogenase [Thermoleptolyngbya sp. PKUAC-SCTB121]
MRVAVFSAKAYDREILESLGATRGHELVFIEESLNARTAVLAAGFPAVCVFVNDQLDATTLRAIAAGGTRFIALRCTGYNGVDLKTAAELGIRAARVAAYSPFSVAEFAVGLVLALNRKIHRAYNRTRDGNFSLEGLMGFDLRGRTVGIIGTGKIGLIFAQIMHGFGCQLLGYDHRINPQFTALGAAQYVELPELFENADIISLHCPLTPETRHLINADTIDQMKRGVMLINTSRGGLIDTEAVIDALKGKIIGALGLDVYEQEADLFFEDLSNEIIQDDVFERLVTFPNVIVTGHQAFFTEDALRDIAETTLDNLDDFEQGQPCPNEITQPLVSA